jgi:hypothetical protein
MSSNDNPGGRWRKSRSSNGQAECVEIAQPRTGIIAVRDSKDPDGPRLAIGPGQWRAFTARIKTGASQA